MLALKTKTRLASSLISLALLTGIVAQGQNWPVPSALFRIRLERDQGFSGPSPAGWAKVWPCGGLDALRCGLSVYTESGRRVSAEVLWAASGDPVQFWFDTSSGETTYFIYLSPNPASSAWRPEAGLLLETRKLKAMPPGAWDQLSKTFPTLGILQGRSCVRRIFHGNNPHGPDENFAARFSGYFKVTQPGEYEFAVVATGAAAVRIDGKLVAVRPANATSRGANGRFNGKINLRPGRHHLEYIELHQTGEFIAEAAWKLPGRDRFEVMPNEAFVPLHGYHTAGAEAGPRAGGKTYLEWETLEHLNLEGLVLVNALLRAPGAGNVQWSFDDGARAAGETVTHLFPRPGVRRITLEAPGMGRRLAAQSELILVLPRWSQREEWRDGLFTQQKTNLLARPWTIAPWLDLGAVMKMAVKLEDQQLLRALSAACLLRLNDASAKSDTEPFLFASDYYQGSRVRDYTSAEKCSRAAVALAQTNVLDRAKLRLAGLLVDCAGKAEEALEILNSINMSDLQKEHPRVYQLFRGDACMALNKIDECAKCYRAAGSKLNPLEPSSYVAHAARLESAKAYVRSGEFDDADRLLFRIEWESPEERLSVDVGLAKMKVFLGRKEYLRALLLGERLLNVAAVDTLRADLLFKLVETNLALGRNDTAQAILSKLLKDHPYSEAAALAKDKWRK